MGSLKKMDEEHKKMTKSLKKGAAGTQPTHESYLPPYLLLNKNVMNAKLGQTDAERAQLLIPTTKDAYNERAKRQDEIERRLVGQLGDRFRDA